MDRIARASLLSLIVLSLTAAGSAQTQAIPKGAAPPIAGGGAAAQAGTAGAGSSEVVATVTGRNQAADKITKAEVLNFLSRYPLPPNEDREAAYQEAVDRLVNTALLNQFLKRQNMPVTNARVEEEIERMKQELKTQGQDLATVLSQNDTSMDEIRKVIENRVGWQEYVKLKATDAELRRFLAENRDLLSGTQIRASHILLKVDPNAPAADKEKVKQKLLSLRNDILQNKIGFAEAANKNSEDPANAGGAGGDLDFFTLQSGFIEEFANPAFKLRKGEISGPVETPFGFHLIQVTDRKEGKLPDFEQNKPYIMQAYAVDLQKTLLNAERKEAKIDIKPMPKDLFPPEPPASSGSPVGKPAASGTVVPKP